MPPPTFQELTHALAILAGAKSAASEQSHPRINQRSASEPLPRKYRWRKLKIAYSEAVLEMYPYLADFDSDGYDDIEAGEEDNFVKWDPINGVHVPRETPLVLTKQYKAEGEYVAAPGDNGPAQLLQGEIDPKTFLGADEELITIPEKDVPLVQILEDQIGLSILLEAAKTVSENGQTEKNDLDDGDMPGPSEKHNDVTENKASVISDLILTPQRLSPCSPILPPIHIVSEGGNHLSIDHEYPPTPGRKWDWQLQSEDGDSTKNQIIFFPADVQQIYEIRRGSDSLFNAEAAGAELYPAGFQLAVDDAVPDVPYLFLSHQYPEFRISDLSWPEGLTWSHVPTPQWELSPATPIPCSPKDGYLPLGYDCNLPTGYDYLTPECKYDLQVQKEKDDLRKSQTDSPTIEAQQKRESRRRPIPLSQLFDDSDSGAESPSEIGPNSTKNPINSPAMATEVLRQSYPETVTPLMESKHEIVQPKITEVKHSSETDLHSDSVEVVDIIDTNKGQIHTHQMKTDSEIPPRPNRPHPAKESNSLHVHHPNKSEMFPNQGLGKLEGDQTGPSLANDSDKSGIALEDGEVGKEVGEANYVEEKTAEEAGVVEMEMGIEVDTLCQRQVSPRPVYTGFAMPIEKCFMINQEVVAISPRGQSVPGDEIIWSSTRGSKSPPQTLLPPSASMVGFSTTIGESPKPVAPGQVVEDSGEHNESLDTSHGDSTSDLVPSSEKPIKYSRESTEHSRDFIDHSSFYRPHKSPGDRHSFHNPCETPTGDSPRPHKHHKDYTDHRDSSRKSYGDSTKAKRSSHKHHKHSRESNPHISHHNHRHDHHHHRRHESRSPSRTAKRSRRHHGSHKRDRNRSRHEAKESSPDRGRRSDRGSKHRQDSNVTDYDKISTGHKRLHRLSSSSPVRQPTSAYQNKTSQDLPSGLQEVPSRKRVGGENEISPHSTRERSADRKHHSHRRQKRHQKRHPGSDSDTSPVNHKASCPPLSVSPARQTNTTNQQEKTPIGVRQRLQEGYGDPHAKLAAQGYFDQQGQLSSASRYHRFNNANHSNGGFYGGYRARGGIYNRHIPGSEAGNVNGFRFIGGSNSLKWRKVDMMKDLETNLA